MLAAALVALLVAAPASGSAEPPGSPGQGAPAGSASMQIVVTIPPRGEVPAAGTAAGTAEVTAAATADTPPTLVVRSDSSGYTAEVTGREAGPVGLWDGDQLVAVVPAGAGPAAFHSNGAVHELVARRGALASAPVAVGDAAARPSATVAVTIPAGSLSVTSRGGAVTVTDTRAGELGFHVSVTAPRGATLRGLRACQVPGNAMRAADVRLAPWPVRLRSGVPTTVAAYPAGLSLGTVRLAAAGPVQGFTWTVL